MIKHIVMMRLKETSPESDKKQQLISIKSKLEALMGKVPTLLSMEVGINFSKRDAAFDLVLVSTFEDETGLEEYRFHSEHEAVLDYLKDLVKETAVTDYLL